jgi:hypothetical protein
MKFTGKLNIFIFILAIIELDFSSNLESKLSSKTFTDVTNQAAVSAKSENKLKTETKLASSFKLKTGSNAKSNLFNKNKNSSNRFGNVELNNLLNPNFQTINKDNIENEISKTTSLNKGNNEILKITDKILADWLMISSSALRDKTRFPDIYIPETKKYITIRLDNMDFRINDAYEKYKDQKENAPNNPNCFWFRLSGLNLYYSSTISDINVLGSISIFSVIGLINLDNDHSGYYCFIIQDNTRIEWKVCSTDKEKRNTWFCAIQITLGVKKDPICDLNNKDDKSNMVVKNVKS